MAAPGVRDGGRLRAGPVRGRHRRGTVTVVTGRAVLTVTGIPGIPGLRASEHTVTSTDLIGSAALPEHLVIAGGGCPGPGGRRRGDRRPPWPPAARAPAARGLGLEAAAVRTAENGAVVVDGHPRAGRPRVFGLGDVNGARSSPASPSTEALNDGLATVVRSDD